MRFFASRHGDLYPVDRIRRIGPLPRREKGAENHETRYRLLTMDDGEQVYIDEYEAGRLLDSPVQILPAQPNTFVLGGVDADDQHVSAVWQTPVIAWGVDHEGIVKPWTAEGEDDGTSQPGPLLMPNGMVQEPGIASYRTIEEWFEAERDAQRAKAAAAKKEA